MVYQRALLRTLSRSAAALSRGADVSAALEDLVECTVELLGVAGCAVVLEETGLLHSVAARGPAAIELEHTPEALQDGPCRDVVTRGEVVAVPDLVAAANRWPHFAATAVGLGLRAVACLPVRQDETTLGTLDLYDRTVREWSADELEAAQVLADLAAGFVTNGARLRQQALVNEQLRGALASRVVIEQAKGFTANDLGVGVDEAFEVMRRHARAHHASVQDVASAIVRAGFHVPSPPDSELP